MKKNERWKKIGSVTFIIAGMFLLWSGFTLIQLRIIPREKIVYESSEPIYETVDEVVVKEVYRQESPIIPVKKTAGREIILLDKSGSMEDFITEIYTSNVKFFSNNDVWAFDTEIHKDISVDNIEFVGDTNMFQAINMAAEQGYDTIWLCSDLEHNTGELKLSDSVKDMNIIVYAPKLLDISKVERIIEVFKKSGIHVKIITMS